MLTSFFSKSKPFIFLIVGAFMALHYLFANFFGADAPLTSLYFLKKTGFLLVYLFLMILVDFIVKRNQVTKRNSFTIVLFAVFTVSFLNILKDGDILVSGLFILLALRRIISLKSGLATKMKIFDASLWICVAALFSEWSLLFLIVVFFAIMFHAANDYRNWIVPSLAILCVYILNTCFQLLVHDRFFDLFHFFEVPDFDFSKYGDPAILFPLSLLLAFSLWVMADYLLTIKKAASTLKSSLVLIVIIWLVAIVVVVFSPTKNGSGFLFFIIPVSVIGANYFQQSQGPSADRIFKEVLLIFLVASTLLWPFLA